MNKHRQEKTWEDYLQLTADKCVEDRDKYRYFKELQHDTGVEFDGLHENFAEREKRAAEMTNLIVSEAGYLTKELKTFPIPIRVQD